MTSTSFRAGALACALLASTILATPALAQENKLIGLYPAEKFAISPGGVDLRTGRYVYSNTDLSIGEDSAADYGDRITVGLR